MVQSLVSACVRGSNARRTVDLVEVEEAAEEATGRNITSNSTAAEGKTGPRLRRVVRLATVDERRRPLDAAAAVLSSLEETHKISPPPRLINPLAAAYLRLGLRSDAVRLIEGSLEERRPLVAVTPPRTERRRADGPAGGANGSGGSSSATRFEEGVRIDLDGLAQLDEEENDDADDEDEGALNVHRLVRNEKDGASYSLLVEGAVREGDWAGAAAELKRMQAAGLHAGPRDLRSWAERGRDRADRPR